MELPATQAMDDELPPTQQFVNDEENNDSPVGLLIIDKTSHPILPGVTSIGRHPQSKVHVDHPTVSINHAAIEAGTVNRTIFIKDVGSSNRTKINETRLRPHSNYQIKDGDNLWFGSIVAKFKLFQAVEDSFISCTPQINRKVCSIIPGTPDSMNASCASEGDMSMIPGTQNDVGTCFRRPEISSKTSTNIDHNSPRVPAFNMDDFENSIYSAETQKSTESKSDDNDRSIYELEIQRPSNVEKANNTFEDLETQQCDPKQLTNVAEKSHNVSIYSAETQKQLPEKDANRDNIGNLETQQFDLNSLNSTTRKSHNLSIYTAETQKLLPEEDINNSIRQSADVSIHSADTQKRLSEGNNSVQEISKLVNVSIHSAETQKAVSEDDFLGNIGKQQFIINKPDSSIRKSIEASIYYAETQKVEPDINVDKSIGNMETQQIDTRKSHIFQTPNLSKRKSTKNSLSEMETQKYDPDSSSVNDESLEDVEIERFECEKSDSEKRKSEIFTPKKKSATESLHEADTQKYLPNTSTNKISNGDESIDDLETEQFISNNPNVENQKPTNPISIEDMETMPFNEEIPLNQSNQYIGKNVEDTNNRNSIDQPGSVHSEKVKSSSQNSSSINNIDTSKSEEHDDVEDEMFSQNLIEDCPFAFLPEESQEKIDQVMNTSKNLEELKQESNSNAKDNISNLSAEISNKSNMSIDKKLVPSADDSETEEEGIFSNPTPTENSTKTSIEKSKSDSETDEEGVFSSHMSKESNNSEISAKNKYNDNTETDEGVFSNPSKSNEKLNSKNNETDSETDEEGIFSNSLSKTNEMNETEVKTVFGNNKNVSTTGNNTSKMNEDDILDKSLKTANISREKNNKSGSEPSKVQTLLFKQNSLNRHTPISVVPDSDDSLFDDNDEDEKTNLYTSEKSNLKEDKSFNQIDNSGASKDKQSMDSVNNKRSKLNETLNATKDTNNEVDNLVPTQVLDTSKSVVDESDSEEEFLAPTQVTSPKKKPTSKVDDKVDDLLVPTQLMSQERSPVKKDSEKFEDLNLEPTQKIETQDCTEFLSSTENEKKSSSDESNKMDRKASVEDLDYEMAPTQPIEDKISEELINSSKRHLEELEITCSKKLKTDDIRQMGVELDSGIENNLKQIFAGAEEEKAINQGPALLTQQLENILQSSQIEEDPTENIVMSVPSPTLSSNRKNSKAKHRRKVMQLKNTDTTSEEKNISIDLNDTIERNLNDMFNASINDVESYESDSMMTQQLANVLESQDNGETNVEETKIQNSTTTKSNLILPSSSKGKAKRSSKTLVEESTEESQGTEEYFANLKSKKKRASVIMDSQSQEEQRNDDEKELVYKHGITDFVDDIGAIRTSKRVPLYESKGMPFTSDSQSEGEDPDSSQGPKRFSLSLSKNVNLNSSLSDWDLERTMAETSAGKEVKQKRVLAKGTRGFKSGSRAPVESEELVSAPSTEGEEEIERSQKKVGKLETSLRLSLDVENEARTSQTVDSDEEFLKSMPDIKVAGTADCPPTNSQLAAPCDDDDDAISLVSVTIPTKNLWYAQKRFDLVYKKPATACANASSNDEREGDTDEEKSTVAPRLVSPLQERSVVPSSEIDEFIASIGKKHPGDMMPKGSASRNSRASRSKRGAPRLCSLSDRVTRSSSKLSVEVLRTNRFTKEANKTATSSSDSDSESFPVIPKYKPLEEARNFKRKMMELARGKPTATNDEPDENDLEFTRLREEFERKMSKTSTSATKTAPRSSPAGARGSRACALTGGTLSGAGSRTTSTTTSRTRSKARIADEDALVFQVPNAGEVDRGGARRRAPLAITRSKRTAAEDSQNQPPKRAKTQKDHVKLQELSNANDQPKKTEKNLIKFPKPSESYVVLQRTKCKTDNTESLLKRKDKTLQNKGENEVRSTSRRIKAKANETTKVKTSIAKGLSSSKDSVMVEDSDSESSSQASTRGTRSRRNKDAHSSAAIRNSKDESSGNSSEDINESTKRTRGKSARQTQKKAAPIKNETIIPDSDQESDESMSKPKEKKIVHQADSAKTEETKRSTRKSTRSRRIKDSDSEKLEDSKMFVNTTTRSRRIRNVTTSKISVNQDSDSEFSKETKSISKKEIKNKKNIKYKKDSDSERSTSPEKNNKVDTPAENKNTRNKSRAKAQNSLNSVFSESDSDQSKNLSVANVSKSSRPVRQVRKRAATDAISSESQEVAEFMASNVEKDTNVTRIRSKRATKKTNANSSCSSQSLKEEESQSDETSEKSTGRAKRARVIKSTKNTRSSPSPTPSAIPSESLLTPTRSRRSSVLSPLGGFQHKVLFTGEKSEVHKNIAYKLGALVIDDPAKCTILVTDKVRRTCKFLCCVARGIPIVTFKWLDESLNAQHFVDWEDYILKDPTSEAQYKFNLEVSLKKAREQKLLEGYTVLLLQIPAKMLSTKELKEIVSSSGGKPLFRTPTKWPEMVVIVTTIDKLQNAKKLITRAPNSVTINSTEFLFTGILRQEVNLQEFKLFS